MKHNNFRLGIRKSFFPMKTAGHWSRLSRGVVATPFKKGFRPRLDNVSSNLL